LTEFFILGEAKGEHEAKINSTFVGPTGVELLKLLHKAQILALTSADYTSINSFYRTNDPRYIHAIWTRFSHIYRTNVFQLHPPDNDLKHFCGSKSQAIPGYPPLEKSLYVRSEYTSELNRLATEISSINPNCIVCLGNTALWALTGSVVIGTARGYTRMATHTAIGWKLLPTYHPTAIFHQYTLRPIVIADLMKAKAQNQFPELRRPKREIWIEPTLEDIREFFNRYCYYTDLLSVDIETYGSRITCIGFSPSPNRVLVIPFEPGPNGEKSYWQTQELETQVWSLIKEILESWVIPKLFQNGLYDIAFLWRSMKIKVMGATEDSMLLHHALQPEMNKSLGFLGSLYSDERMWKGMRKHETIKRDD
jgi:uracil-DNA glycosylase